MKRALLALPVVVLLVLTALPGSALACPSCATRDSAGPAIFALIAAMIGVPYVIAAVTIRVFRRLEKES